MLLKENLADHYVDGTLPNSRAGNTADGASSFGPNAEVIQREMENFVSASLKYNTESSENILDTSQITLKMSFNAKSNEAIYGRSPPTGSKNNFNEVYEISPIKPRIVFGGEHELKESSKFSPENKHEIRLFGSPSKQNLNEQYFNKIGMKNQ